MCIRDSLTSWLSRLLSEVKNMQNPRYNQPRLKKWLRGKGFYVALAVCLLGAGLASWALIQNAVQSGDPQSPVSYTHLPSGRPPFRKEHL